MDDWRTYGFRTSFRFSVEDTKGDADGDALVGRMTGG
jgi:hypothetical protein